MNPQKQFILNILTERLKTNLVLYSKADHHQNIILAQLSLAVNCLDANPFIAIIAEGKNFLRHEPPSMY